MDKSLSYEFIINMWAAKRVDESFVLGQLNRGRLTTEESSQILATPQTPAK